MYSYISGVFVSDHKDSVTVETSGIGWKIFVTTKFLKELPQKGTKIRLFVSHIVREESQSLYGFENEKEKMFFEELLNINGIGPKTALAFIGNVEFHELSQAILQKDIRPLCAFLVLGKKLLRRCFST
jgi:holliday junction DNA helicase RuvA